MYPMISGVDELRKANAILETCREELRAEGVPFTKRWEVGR
jgi:phosphotransferase system enzyme I (PtsI)